MVVCNLQEGERGEVFDNVWAVCTRTKVPSVITHLLSSINVSRELMIHEVSNSIVPITPRMMGHRSIYGFEIFIGSKSDQIGPGFKK